MLKSEILDDTTVVSFEDTNKFHALNADSVKEQLNAHFKQENTKLIINLDGIKFIDSTGFGVFLSVLKTANTKSGQLKLCNVAPEVYDLLKLLQLHTVFSIQTSVDECINSFN